MPVSITSGRPNGKRTRIDWDHVGLGKASDNAIARELGVSSTAVRLQRKKRGIPVYGSGLRACGRSTIPPGIRDLAVFMAANPCLRSVDRVEEDP